MAIEFKLPELGENVSAGTIAKILVKVGDTVSAEQSILEVETDKAVAEIPCPTAGKITAIKVKEGQKVKAGDVILLIEAGAASKAEAPKAEEPKAKPAPAPAPAERPAPKLQVLERPAPAPAVASAPRSGGAVLASPSVRRLAREHGIDLASVPVADPSGRVTAQDIMAVINGTAPAAQAAPAEAPAKAASASAAAPAMTGDGDKWGAVVLEPMSGIRRKTAERMTQNWTTIPHVTHFEKADVTALEALRKKHAKQFDAFGAKLTVTSFIIKVLGEALKRFPKFNASVDLAGEQLVYKQYYNVGVAVDTPNGLLVPVMRHVDQMSIRQISIELPMLAAKARDRKLSIEDMQGGTFTISNLGGLGGYAFTPIINSPEVAILGVSRSSVEPVWQDGQFSPRTMLPLSLSYDHRIIDGADAARFTRWVVEALENPWVLFLED